MKGKHHRKVGTTHVKNQETILLSTNPKEDNHTNIKITSKISGSNNLYFLISLNINGLNSPIKKTQTNRLDT